MRASVPFHGKGVFCLASLVALCLTAAWTASPHAAERGVRVVTGENEALPPGPSDESIGQKWAVIVGVGQFLDPALSPLPNAVRDAEAFAQALIDGGAGFQEDHVILLTDNGKNELLKPSKGAIFHALTVRLNGVTSNDMVLFYFAGHGMEAEGSLYLMGRDALSAAPEATGLAFSDVERFLGVGKPQGERPKVTMVLLDACHSGTGRSAKTLSPDALNRIQAGVEKHADGWLVLASCGASELSYEYAEGDHGAFSHFLLDGLAGAADQSEQGNKDGAVSCRELSEYAEAAVTRWAMQNNFKQKPRLLANISGDVLLSKTGVFDGDDGDDTTDEPHESLPVSFVSKDAGTKRSKVEVANLVQIADRFVDNKDGTVQDTYLNLEWVTEAQPLLTYDAACSWCDSLNSATGRSGWRLPTDNELQTLLASEMGRVRLYKKIFKGSSRTSQYWLSGLLPSLATRKIMSLKSFAVSQTSKSEYCAAFAVRDLAEPSQGE